MSIFQHRDPDDTARLTYTIEEAAKLLGVGRNTAYEAAKTGDLPVVRIGGRLIVPRARLAELLGENLPRNAEGARRKEVTPGAPSAP
jgi:excisionase family DNA binding protein